MNREKSWVNLIAKQPGRCLQQKFSTISESQVKQWTNRLIVSAFVVLAFLAACSPTTPAASPDNQANRPVTRETARPTVTPTVKPTATTDPNLPGGPDELTEAQIHTPPKSVPIQDVEKQTPAEQGPFPVTGELKANGRKQFDDESRKLNGLGYKVVTDSDEMNGENTVFLSGYEYASSPEFYRWTIAGTTAKGFVHATVGDKFAGDPGYISLDSSFEELVDGFGSDVIRTWELYGDNWTPVVRNADGELLAVYNFDTRSFTLEKDNSKVLLGLEADQSLATEGGTVFFLDGAAAAFVDNEGVVRELVAGMEMREDGSIWGVNPETGRFEKQILPGGIDPVKTIEQYTGPVEKDQGKILGLNEFGWAVTEYKDGKWVPFVREIMIIGSGENETYRIDEEDLPGEMLRPLTPEEIHSIPLQQLFERRGVPWGDYLGMKLPVTEEGKLKTGYLDDWDDNMKFYSGYALGAVDISVGGIDGVWLMIEIPYKTQRQLVAYFIPNQVGYSNDVYTYREVGADGKDGIGSSMLDREPILYKDLCNQLKASKELRGWQVLFARQIFVYKNREFGQLVGEAEAALEKGIGINAEIGSIISHMWLPEWFWEK